MSIDVIMLITFSMVANILFLSLGILLNGRLSRFFWKLFFINFILAVVLLWVAKDMKIL